MSFFDVFRGFFGLPGRRRPRDPLFGGTAWDEDEEEEGFDGSSLAQPPQDFGFGFGFGPGASRGSFEELFRDVGELLGISGGAWAAPPQPFEPALPSPGEGGAGRSLRESMLKHPDSPPASASPDGPGSSSDPARPWRPFLGLHDVPPAPPALREDRDLDSQVSSAGLGTILRPDEPQAHSYFQSVSVTKVTLPDGAVEEHRTVQDSQGRRETTVTRRRGDQAFITTTKENGQGKDYREEVVNMDDRELAHFTGTWPRQDELHAPNPSDPSSALGSFFRRWFSSW